MWKCRAMCDPEQGNVYKNMFINMLSKCLCTVVKLLKTTASCP